jgi:hypothetical protein
MDMKSSRAHLVFASVSFLLGSLAIGCGGGGSEAQRRGVGAACAADKDCTETGQTCLAFKGGYCGVSDCVNDAGCPAGSACVSHTDGKNYCFLICTDKPQCNLSRAVDVEANCSSNVTFVEGTVTAKACVPPSG